ncbi:MAG: hypothetical protein LUH23_05705 [Oscillospiraceae bacterium]|nr:hypothetical protein [Oscillospiraceae bacterium]
MPKTGQTYCGTSFCGSDDVLPASSTQDDLMPAIKNYTKKIVESTYTSLSYGKVADTVNGLIPEYSPSLPAELDIFCKLPRAVYENSEVGSFLSALKTVMIHAYRQSKLENLILSKLIVSECSETEVVIDWVFNYFQMYFSFSKKDGNYWGMVMVNNEEGEFGNSVIKIRPEKLTEQANLILNTAVMLIR